MGLLTLLDSRTHRNLALWKRIKSFTAYVYRLVAVNVER